MGVKCCREFGTGGAQLALGSAARACYRPAMLERRRFVAAAALLLVVATLLHWGTVDDGLLLDDIAIYGGMGLAKSGHPGAHWWDVYFLGGYDERLRFSGSLPWWVAEGVQLHFFRPAAAGTHYFDVLLWPENTRAMHIHNLVWFFATGCAVLWLYTDALRSRGEALLALAVFMLAYIHEWPVQWLAARNSQMALCFGALSVLGFRRWSDGLTWKLLAGAGLLASLLSSELGVSVLAFVVGFELVRKDDAAKRLPRVGLAVGVIGLWRVGYVLGGYGAIGAGTYIDPLSAPLAFLREAPQRLSVQLVSLVGPPELLMPAAVPLAWRVGFWVVGVGSLLLVLRVVRDRDVRPWILSAGFCLIPLASSIPQPRLLGFVLLGLAPWIARAISTAWADSGWRRGAVAFLGLHHLVLGPLLVTGALDGVRPTDFGAFGEPGADLGDVGGRNLLLLNPPTYASAKMVGAVRSTRGLPMPAFAWALGVGDNIEITREGCCTVVLRSEAGFFRERWAAMYRGPQVPFEEGDVVHTLAFEAQVREVTDRGFAEEVAFKMTGPLRSPQFVFARWNGRDYQVVRPREIPRR